MKILIAGALTSAASDPRVSGTAISLKHLIGALRSTADVEVTVVDVGDIRKSRNRALSLLSSLKEIWLASKQTEIITLHLSPFGFAILSIPLLVIAHLRKQPVIYRMFGGREIDDVGVVWSTIAYWCLHKYDRYLAQTQRLLTIADKHGMKRVSWFPTSRPVRPVSIKNPQRKKTNRVVYLAHIRYGKGILELIEASDLLSGVTKVDIYGPFHDGLDESIFEGHENIEYRGVVAPEDVDEILTDGVALVLPSYLVGEGYPGSVIEAFNAGLPVISTTWCSIPEIVDDKCGILVEPKNAKALADAIRELVADPVRWSKLSNGAYERRLFFDQDKAVSSFMEICLEELDKRNGISSLSGVQKSGDKQTILG